MKKHCDRHILFCLLLPLSFQPSAVRLARPSRIYHDDCKADAHSGEGIEAICPWTVLAQDWLAKYIGKGSGGGEKREGGGEEREKASSTRFVRLSVGLSPYDTGSPSCGRGKVCKGGQEGRGGSERRKNEEEAKVKGQGERQEERRRERKDRGGSPFFSGSLKLMRAEGEGAKIEWMMMREVNPWE